MMVTVFFFCRSRKDVRVVCIDFVAHNELAVFWTAVCTLICFNLKTIGQRQKSLSLALFLSFEMKKIKWKTSYTTSRCDYMYVFGVFFCFISQSLRSVHCTADLQYMPRIRLYMCIVLLLQGTAVNSYACVYVRWGLLWKFPHTLLFTSYVIYIFYNYISITIADLLNDDELRFSHNVCVLPLNCLYVHGHWGVNYTQVFHCLPMVRFFWTFFFFLFSVFIISPFTILRYNFFLFLLLSSFVV